MTSERLCIAEQKTADECAYGYRLRKCCSIMKKLLIAGIRFYQKHISHLKSTRCPYIPCCSQYGLEAVEKYGAVKGSLLAVWRILRCNPFSKGGYDPVP